MHREWQPGDSFSYLVFGDPHITPDAEFSEPTADGLTTYLHQVIKSFEWIESVIKDRKPDLVVCLGDLFESTGFVDTVSLHVAIRLCNSLNDVCRFSGVHELYFLVGNHDMYSANFHNLSFLSLTKDISVVSHRFVIPFMGCNISFLPWELDTGQLESAHRAADFVFAHREMYGASLGKTTSEVGLRQSDLNGIVFNGHYHETESLGKRFHNVGSLLSRTFKDADCAPKCIMVGSSDEDLPLRIRNPHDIPFTTIDIKSAGMAAGWSESLQDAVAFVHDSYVRVRCRQQYQDVADQIAAVAAGVRVELIPEEIQARDHVSEAFTPDENFTRFVEEHVFDEDEERDAVLKRGLEYLSSVRSQSKAIPSLEFQSVQIDNFQSIGHASLSLNGRGLVYVEGINKDDPANSNGAGKSSIGEAIYWGLTGDSLRGYQGNDVVRWGETSCKVDQAVKINGSDYLISRARIDGKPKVELLALDEQEEAADISARKAKDVSKQIRDLLGRSDEILQHSIFLTGDMKANFTSLSYPDRVKLIEQITGSDVYSAAFELVNKDVAGNKMAIGNYYAQVDSFKESFDKSRERVNQLNGSLAEARREQEARLNELKTELQSVLSTLDGLEKQYSELATTVDDSAKDLVLLEEWRADTSSRDALANSIATFQTEIRMLRIELRRKQDLINKGMCPTCGQPIGSDADICSDADALKEGIESRMSELKLHQVNHDEIADILRVQINNHTQDLTTARKKHKELFDKCSIIKAQMSDLEGKSNSIRNEMSRVRASIDSVLSRLDEAKQVVESNKALLEQARSYVEKAEKEKHVLDFLFEAFSTKGIRAQILSAVTIPFLNSRLELANVPARLVTQVETKTTGEVRDKIDIQFVGSRTYKGCSRGEKRRIDLAIQCALNDLARMGSRANINLLVCDEVIDPLDETGVLDFIDVLKDKAAAGMTVLLMSHKRFVDSYAPTKISVVKENGVSRLEV